MSGPPKDDVRGFFDDPRRVRLVMRSFYALCALALAAEWAIHKHAGHPAEAWFGFHGAYGFLAIVVLVLLAKGLRRVVLRPEDYYGDE